MEPASPPLSKISPPRLANALGRDRLLRMLTAPGPQLFWLQGPPGTGKTTLAAQVLSGHDGPALWYRLDTGDRDVGGFFHDFSHVAASLVPGLREALPVFPVEAGLQVEEFARTFFRRLFQGLPGKGWLVLDDFQAVGEAAALDGVLAVLLTELPPCWRVIVTSQELPPRQLARARLSGQLRLLNWDCLRFSEEECGEALALLLPEVPAPTRAQLAALAGGWAAALAALAVEHLEAGPFPAGALPETLSEYLADAIFDRLDDPARRLLIHCAWLPEFNGAAAVEVSGVADADRILAELARRRRLVSAHGEAEPVYRLHGLFRQFLQQCATTQLSDGDRLALLRRSARALAEAGSAEAALECWLTAEDWVAAVGLILRQASVMLAGGRWRTLQGWIERVPADVQARVLPLRHLGALMTMLVEPRLARLQLDTLLRQYLKQNQPQLALRVWSDITATFVLDLTEFHDLARWLELFEQLDFDFEALDREHQARVALGVTRALFYTRPDSRDWPHWEAIALSLLREGLNPDLQVRLAAQLAHFYRWSGRHHQARALESMLEPMAASSALAPGNRLVWFYIRSANRNRLAQPAEVLATAQQGLQLAESLGLHWADSHFHTEIAHTALVTGDGARFDDALARLESELDPARRLDVFRIFNLKAWRAALEGDGGTAVALAEAGFAAAEASGARFLILPALVACAYAHTVAGDGERARDYLQRLEAANARLRAPYFEFHSQVLRAWYALNGGDPGSLERATRHFLEIGADEDYDFLLWFMPRVMEPLCNYALERGIAADYARRLVRLHALEGRDAAEPGLRIYTFGRFALERDGAPVSFGRKSPRRLLELLMLLVALGGRDVHPDRLIEALWADADGDDATRSLQMALHRLRKLLGGNDSVQVNNRLISLNPALVWTDLEALQRQLVDLRRQIHHQGDVPALAAAAERLLDLYPGEFLPDEQLPQILWVQQQLRERVTGALHLAAQTLLGRGEPASAERLLRRAVEVDGSDERLHLGLIQLYREADRSEDAAAACRQAAAALGRFGLKPSAALARLTAELAPLVRQVG